ncbi:Protein CBG07990 [Caenorhabditis briggsae]|uniref:Protein CBG07990 n=1 Tax=Caenorhabditis briggsae TaxID=6238 RepID=A8X5I7_CAEBR|nr:Protein CBG07990 [Caenorhabditis briggsae]CAP27898.1 Protein CBG07990 [Caenorhabditis briggsae]
MHISSFNNFSQVDLVTRDSQNRIVKSWRLHFVPFTGSEWFYKGNFHYPVYFKNSCENFVFLVVQLQEVFEVKHETLRLEIGEEWNAEKMKPYVEWMNGFNWESGKIPSLNVVAKDEPSLKFLLENMTRDVGRMEIQTTYSERCQVSSVNFKMDVLTGSGKDWLDRKMMRSMDAIRMDFYQTDLTNLDMNQFLRSWKEETSNGRIQEIRLPLKERVKFTNDNQLYQLHGGFDITRADGRMATIGHNLYNLSFENAPIQQYEIEECTRISRVWNLEQSDEEDEIEDVVVLEEGAQPMHIALQKDRRKQGRRYIFMIVW